MCQCPLEESLYLALAAKRDVPLVTADRKLVAALRKRRKPAPQVQSLDDL
jgi:predicted nucleic acid-binding protein